MNSLFKRTLVYQLTNQLRQISNRPNATRLPFNAMDASKIREDILTIAKDVEHKDPQISSLLIRSKDILFYTNQYGQAILNPYALGEVLFGLDYLVASSQASTKKETSEKDIWSYIHPQIQKSSKLLYINGHYSNAAEDAFIELNSRAKSIYKKIVPNTSTVPDGTDLMHKLFGSNPLLCPVCDTSTESGDNYQQGFHFMTAGAMSALRNPKAHSNDEKLSAEEAMRRLMFASMLMYKLDEAGM